MKKIFIALVALLLVSTFLLTGCGAHGATLIEAGDNELSINLYRFYLSRIKGDLVRQGHAAGMADYWIVWENDTQTRADVYNEKVLEALRLYGAALILYDEMNLELSDSDEAQIDADVEALIAAAGSESALDAKLAPYGANTTVLRDSFVLETKLKQLKLALYGENGGAISPQHKESFYQENYVRGFQIYLSNSYYEYQVDGCGNPIYYYWNEDNTLGAVAYDTVNGVAEQDEKGNTVYRKFGSVAYDVEAEGVFKSDERDDEGYLIYYTDEGKATIAYDKINGVPATTVNEAGETVPELDAKGNQVYRKWVYAYVSDPELVGVKYEKDNNGKYKEEKYSSEEMERRVWQAAKIYEACNKLTDYQERESAFLSYAKLYSDGTVDNGMYFMKDGTSAYADITELQKIGDAVQSLEVGAMTSLSFDSGVRLVMRAALDEGAWSKEENALWFATGRHNMTYYLIEQMLEAHLTTGGYLNRLEIDTELLATVSITDVSPNLAY